MATDSTRSAILDAARQVLFDEGWEALSHQRVAERAGVGRATVYRHWPQRLQLLQDACSAEMLTIHTQPTGDLRGDLAAELESMRRETVERRAGRVLIALTDRAVWEPEIAQVKARMLEEGLRNLRLILQRGIDGGSFAPDLDLDATVSRIVGSWVYRYLILDQEITPEMVEAVLDDFLAANLLVP
jgi:AcrR family transcriptional regulator